MESLFKNKTNTRMSYKARLLPVFSHGALSWNLRTISNRFRPLRRIRLVSLCRVTFDLSSRGTGKLTPRP